MALMMRARPVLARARPQMTKRMLTQTSAEARRYSFAHAIDDIAGKAAFGGGSAHSPLSGGILRGGARG